jgi:ElaB/YqjD/DUF883 family membrane-anchored ribosome-binding protein
MDETTSGKPFDVNEEIAQLRRQIEQLINQRLTPVLSDAAKRAEATVRSAFELACEQAEAVSARTREQPLTALLIAAGTGYLIGRLSR